MGSIIGKVTLVAVILAVATLIAILVPVLTKIPISTSTTTSKISRVYEILCIIQTLAFTKSIILSVKNDLSVLKFKQDICGTINQKMQ
jgi:hypothetical protein